MIKLLIFFLLLLSSGSFANTIDVKSLSLDSSIIRTSEELFISRPNSLALNLKYQPIKDLRIELASNLGKDLKFFTGWSALGEAHVTTITPPEYKALSHYVSLEEINQIAREMEIQNADLEIQGLGSGEDLFNGEIGSTYFVIVKSKRLFEIREEVEKLALSRGMKYRDFEAQLFFPHITVGYTHEDIHYPIVIKNYEESIDLNFELLLK
jgi:2'-5' RNA ligase